MAYVKNIWVDQDVERPKTYEVTNNQDGSITLTDSFGLVTELGTPVNEVNMNHIEDGIDGCAIRKHNLTETFNLGEWVLGGTGDAEGIYKSLIPNNVGNAITDDTKWEKFETGANTQLSNVDSTITSIPPTALTNFDGQHTSVDYVFIQSANLTNTQGAVTQLGVYDISSALPNDNYSYEVTLVMQFTAPAATNRVTILVGGNGSQALNGFNIASRAGQCMEWCTASVPVSSARTIGVNYITQGGTATLNYMQLISYRRIGTNE